MDRRISIPDIEVRIECPQYLWIVADWLLDDARLAGIVSRRLLYPTCNAAADTAFVIEQQYWFRLFLRLWQSASFHDSKGCVITFRTLDTVGCGPSTRPTSLPCRNMIKVGVP